MLQLAQALEHLQYIPAPFIGDALLLARLLGHLQEQEIGELGHVLVVRHPVVLEDVAEVPELADDVVGGAHFARLSGIARCSGMHRYTAPLPARADTSSGARSGRVGLLSEKLPRISPMAAG